MRAAVARKPVIRIAVVESDPLRFVGFRALFDSEPEFELISAKVTVAVSLQIDLEKTLFVSSEYDNAPVSDGNLADHEAIFLAYPQDAEY